MVFNPPLPSPEFQKLVRKELFDAENRAREVLGLFPKGRHQGRTRYWTHTRCIKAIQDFNAEHGRPPTANEWTFADREGMRPAKKAVINRFGTWSKGIEAAGFEPRKSGAQPEQKGKRRGPYKIKQKRDELFAISTSINQRIFKQQTGFGTQAEQQRS